MKALFIKQKEDFCLAIHKEAVSIKSELETFISGKSQMHERDIANIQQNVFALNQRLQALSEKLDSVQLSLGILKETMMETRTNDKGENDNSCKPHITVYYAKMVDSVCPLGFKISSLKNTEEGCAFKITLSENLEGNYEIIDNEEIRQEILSAFNPLVSESSEYDFVPQNPTQIQVIKSGKVIKEENILKITNKQQIKIL